MVKKRKNNIEKFAVTNGISDLYTDQWNQVPRMLNEEKVDQLARDMMTYIKNNNELIKMNQVLEKFGMLPPDFYRLCEKFKKLDAVRQFGLLIFGNRREAGGITNRYNAMFVRSTMSHYDQDFVKDEERRANLQAKKDSGYSLFNYIEIPAIPNSDLVPVKKSESVDVGEE